MVPNYLRNGHTGIQEMENETLHIFKNQKCCLIMVIQSQQI